ncbi:Protein CURVATURE THYLAKOID 1A, chloroplastic [Pleodorina starrii]|uniref:Protein CURVATURE THYLAKOID 1A, chloroplastic n=1 Tax=Pleodorina starrii TaxID=330485 RepID=A0A9W6C0X1_9CHLO|nr:Protein CURVATURE THYLAKOID 1A [Pleodorina starrii]GLC61868.1 Protein CURVATURE THYLAKOID 1A, chloroplastic [Pleodorina starrii]GLC75935.1 Protein CURVATURE THYLAKOID 1A [Pleodorina starrii]
MMLAAKPSLSICKGTARRSVPAGPRAVRPAVGRCQRLVVRAEETTTTTSSSFDSEKVLKDLQQKWDAVENKGTVAAYAAGAVVALWLSSTIVNAINSVPLLPKMMELVGLGYSAWFTYRYLLFKSSREELLKDIGELSKKISGSE